METVRASWSEYRDKLLPIIERTAQRNEHDFVGQVDEALNDDRAFLFIADDGFMILKPTHRSGCVWVTVMFAFNWGENAIERYQPEIEKMTKQIGGRGVELYTAVTALSPILCGQGYERTGQEGKVQHWQKAL